MEENAVQIPWMTRHRSFDGQFCGSHRIFTARWSPCVCL